MKEGTNARTKKKQLARVESEGVLNGQRKSGLTQAVQICILQARR